MAQDAAHLEFVKARRQAHREQKKQIDDNRAADVSLTEFGVSEEFGNSLDG